MPDSISNEAMEGFLRQVLASSPEAPYRCLVHFADCLIQECDRGGPLSEAFLRRGLISLIAVLSTCPTSDYSLDGIHAFLSRPATPTPVEPEPIMRVSSWDRLLEGLKNDL